MRVNGFTDAASYHENLEEDVTKQPWAKNGFDKVLLDPARAGAAGVMQQIIKLEPIRSLMYPETRGCWHSKRY